MISCQNLVVTTSAIGMALALTACMTPAKERQLRDDMFNLQTRVMQLEGQLQKQDKNFQSNDQNANQRIASTSTQLERMNGDIQRIKGDIDALKIGVTTGQLPGTDPEQEGSVAKTLRDLTSRVEAIEENQKEILSAIQKAGGGGATSSKKKADKEKSDSGKAKTYTEMKRAFGKKNYKVVAEQGGEVLDTLKKKSQREELLYMMAESLYKIGKMRDAALRYNDFVDMNPSEKRVPHAKLRMGDCFRHLGDKNTAKLYYEEIVSRFPNAPEAKKAKDTLAKL